MLSEYSTVRRAVHRSMLRWWKRSGWWWLAALLLLVIADAVLRGFLVPYMEEISRRASANNGMVYMAHLAGLSPWQWMTMANCIVWMARAVALLGCLLAAAQVLHIAEDIQHDFAHPAPRLALRLKYLLALEAGWPFALLWLVIGSSVLALLGRIVDSSYGWQLFNTLQQTDNNFTAAEPWSTLVTLVTGLALVMACGKRRAPAYFWLVLAAIIPMVVQVSTALRTLHLPQVPLYALDYRAPARLGFNYAWLVSLAGFSLLLFLYARGMRTAAGLLLALCLGGMLLSNSGLGYQVRKPPVALSSTQQLYQNINLPEGSAVNLGAHYLRWLAEYPSMPLVQFQVFSRQRNTVPAATRLGDREHPAVYGGLVINAPARIVISSPPQTGFAVAPLNLAYLALTIAAMMALLSVSVKRGTPASS